MKYFTVELDKCFLHAPQIINWFENFQVDKLNKESQQEIPFRTSLKLNADKDVEFTDVISHPCFGVSEMVHELLMKFEPNLTFKEIMVYDPKNEYTNLYYVPILDEVECLTDNCIYNLDRSQLVKIEIDERKIRDKSIFQLAGVKKNYTVMRLDLVEALLRRNVIGLALEEIDVMLDKQ